MTYSKAKQDVLAKLRFKAQGHIYSLDRMRIPSVTQIIDPLLPYASLPREIREAALIRGDIVHKLTALADQGKPWEDGAAIDAADMAGYLFAWESFKHTTECRIVATEQRVYHRTYRYAGTLDRLVILGDDPSVAVLEIKTGELMPEYALQTAAYLHAVNDGRARGEPPVERRYVVQLMPTGKFHPLEHRERGDFQVFLAALTIQSWRMRYA